MSYQYSPIGRARHYTNQLESLKLCASSPGLSACADNDDILEDGQETGLDHVEAILGLNSEGVAHTVEFRGDTSVQDDV